VPWFGHLCRIIFCNLNFQLFTKNKFKYIFYIFFADRAGKCKFVAKLKQKRVIAGGVQSQMNEMLI
jgi:hypothetical protein